MGYNQRMLGKTYLFVDGSNLYGSQYALFGPNKLLLFDNLIKQLESQLTIRFSKIFFYASYSPRPLNPTKKQLLFLKNEGLFYRNVKTLKNVIFFKGYRSPTSGKEKENVSNIWRCRFSPCFTSNQGIKQRYKFAMYV